MKLQFGVDSLIGKPSRVVGEYRKMYLSADLVSHNRYFLRPVSLCPRTPPKRTMSELIFFPKLSLSYDVKDIVSEWRGVVMFT